ncbi:alpha/beta hydrolase [Streptomyces sp. NPDC056347]|uniref:alpha/beta hydrolase n=1 Tax=Streptomyces sp. NPDC056347 TaxID=3345790 RepID=UPI0035D62CBB
MSLTWDQLRDLKCGELEGAADSWGKASNRADAGRDRIENQLLNGLRTTQHGEAATAAVGRLRRMSRNLGYVYTECGLLRTTLNSMAHELRLQQRDLNHALEDAEALGLDVHADGSVTYPAAGKALLDDAPLPGGTVTAGPAAPGIRAPSGLVGPNPMAAEAQGIADRVAKAVRTAAEIDWRYARILRELRAGEGVGVPDSAWQDAAGDAAAVRGAARGYLKDEIPRDASPAERRAWWAALTDERREEYLAVYPNLIGNLDGIPSLVRDAANRDNLQLLMGELEGRDDTRSRTQLAALHEIDRQLQAGSKPPMYLLGISDEGNGRAIVAFGNPDTARNVAAYVPGLGTALDGDFAKNDLKRARDTAIGAQSHDPSSAAIVWLGYDAPQTPIDDPLGAFAVAGDERAERGGVAYRSFMDGIKSTNEHEDSHLTAIGHSYGSRTVGAATQRGGGIPGVDDIVLVGSPGVGVDHAEDLGVGKDHVFVGAAENDPVTKLPSKKQSVAGVMGLLSGGPAMSYLAGDAVDPGDDELWFGRDPASEAFGARRFPVGEGSSLLSGKPISLDAHSQYFDPQRDHLSSNSIALIVAGKSQMLKAEEYR